MANTRSSYKRAKQSTKKHLRNQMNRKKAKTSVRKVLSTVETNDLSQLKTAYQNAVKVLHQVASKGAIPKKRASRKISRLTLFLKKQKPDLF